MSLLLRAYATIPEFLKSITGIDSIPDIPINTYGTFVAIGFLVAAYIASIGLKDRGKLGLLAGFTIDEIVGKKPSVKDLIAPFAMWFIIGFKFIGAIIHEPSLLTQGQQTVSFILSTEGFLHWGVIVGGLAAGLSYYQLNKKALPKPETKKVKVKVS